MAFSRGTAFEFIQRAHRSGRLGHAYLISGPIGSGKRDFALDLAAMVTGRPIAEVLSAPDVHTAEPESKLRRIVVEQVRELEQALQLKASGRGRKVAILFEADRLQPQASNAFLKTLEEPPSNSLLLLVSSHPEMLLDTIRSRCIKVVLHREGELALDEDEAAALESLVRFHQTGKNDLAAVFGLTRDFLDLFAEVKGRIAEQYEDDLKRERDHYGKTTDGAWLEERETHYKALIEAQYQIGRIKISEVIGRWFGDILRQRCGPSSRLDFPAHAALTGQLAQSLDLPRLLKVSDEVDALRENLGRTVQEALAVEVAFLKIFGTR